MTQTFDPSGPATGPGLFGLPHAAHEARVVVLAVPFQATTSYRRGTAGAPSAVLEASHQVELWDIETGDPWREGLAMVGPEAELEALDLAACADADLARAGDEAASARVDAAGQRINEHVGAWAQQVLASGRVPAVLGGDHSVPFGAIRAAALARPGMGLLHVDAHADLRDAYEGFAWSHASIIHNLLGRVPELGPVVQVGVRDQCREERQLALDEPRVHQWPDALLGDRLAAGQAWEDVVEELLAPLPEEVWVSFDIDGLDPSLCPRTGTPVPGGLSWREAMVLLAALGRSGRRIIGFDLCEVGIGEIDALVGARLLYKLAGWAITSAGGAAGAEDAGT